MKTISIRLDDSTYEELGAMLEAMGQTKQTFFETYTRMHFTELSGRHSVLERPLSEVNGRLFFS